MGLDICNGVDLGSAAMTSIIAGWIVDGLIVAIWLGTPCESWSVARRGKRTRHCKKGWPAKLRAKGNFIWGLSAENMTDRVLKLYFRIYVVALIHVAHMILNLH